MYYYRCGTPRGEVLEGIMELPSKGEVRLHLEGCGYRVFEIRVHGRRSAPFRLRRNLKETILFSKLMASLVGSGISLPECLSSIHSQIGEGEFKKSIWKIMREVGSGSSLSQAMRGAGGYFDDLFCSMVESGERSGVLDETFSMIHRYLVKRGRIEKKVISASIYPVFLMVFSLGAIFFLSIFVLPSFSGIYTAFDRELPYITRLVLKITGGVAARWHIIILSLAGLAYGSFRLLQVEEYRLFLHENLLSLSPLKRYIYMKEVSSFFSVLSLSLRSGMDIVEAMRVSQKNIQNLRIRRDVYGALQEVIKGERLSTSLSRIGFPPLAIQFVSAGEGGNNLEEMLSSVSEYYEEELSEGIDMAVSLMEPVMIIFVGGIVGVIVMAIMLPILSLSTAVV